MILGVAQQEMLHLAINANLITALGASPHLSRPNLPQPARHYPPGVLLTWLPFGEQALRHFLYLERPEGLDIADAAGLAAVGEALPMMGDQDIAPHLQDFATVGHLYRSIEAGLRHLLEKLGEDRLFVGPADSQARGELFHWPELEPITNTETAIRAIESIVEQGGKGLQSPIPGVRSPPPPVSEEVGSLLSSRFRQPGGVGGTAEHCSAVGRRTGTAGRLPGSFGASAS